MPYWKAREELERAQRFVCPYCGHDLRRRGNTVDHVLPKAHGGADALGNLLMCHGACNERKAHRLPRGCELVWLISVNMKIGAWPQSIDG